MAEQSISLPDIHPTLRLTTRPNDANPGGDIFGGWLMSQIDIAGAIVAAVRAKGPVVTVAVKSLQFLHPLYIHDLVSFYAEITKTGQTSITVDVQVYAQRQRNYTFEAVRVSDATLVYVAVSQPGKKRQIIN